MRTLIALVSVLSLSASVALACPKDKHAAKGSHAKSCKQHKNCNGQHEKDKKDETKS